MQTLFTLAQLADPRMAESERILRSCVHCGFCTATCPTYLLGGDELDSPRGRIYLIKDMLEYDRPSRPEVVKHIDRCLSCLACMTACPSGVHYMHLVDHARARIEANYVRPWHDRWLRALLAGLLPDNARFRWALRAARLAQPLAPLLAAIRCQRLAAMLRLVPPRLPRPSAKASGRVIAAQGVHKGRVALLTGCVSPVLRPAINEAAIRLLTRHGFEVVPVEGCCGSLAHHLGHEHEALAAARARIDALTREIGAPLDAVLVTASGCGTTVKDYGFMLRSDSAYAAKAAAVSALARDIGEYLGGLDLEPVTESDRLVVAYHAACSLEHGQRISREPRQLLRQMGFTVRDIPEAHLCCGSAGIYNILQPDIAKRLRERKVGNIEKLAPNVIAAGNIGCITQIAAATAIPVVHTVELIDWKTGGRKPGVLGESA